MNKTLAKFPALLLILIVGIIAAPSAFASVTIVIQNADPAGVGCPTTAVAVAPAIGRKTSEGNISSRYT